MLSVLQRRHLLSCEAGWPGRRRIRMLFGLALISFDAIKLLAPLWLSADIAISFILTLWLGPARLLRRTQLSLLRRVCHHTAFSETGCFVWVCERESGRLRVCVWELVRVPVTISYCIGQALCVKPVSRRLCRLSRWVLAHLVPLCSAQLLRPFFVLLLALSSQSQLDA